MANRVMRGPTVEVGETLYPAPEIIDEIMDMIRDEGDADAASVELVEIYADADAAGRVHIDNTLVAISGYNMKSLLQQCMADADLMVALKLATDLETELDEG